MSIIADDNDFKKSKEEFEQKHKNPIIKPETINNDKKFKMSIRPKKFDT